MRISNGTIHVIGAAYKTRREAIAERLGPRAHMIELAAVRESYGPSKPYGVAEGVAVINIAGVLSNDPWYGDTSYTSICDALNQANADPMVKSIVLRFDSPGGETDGAFETAQLLATIAANKRCIAVADPCAFSAAYLLASQTSEVWAAPTSGGVGSIGVYAAHVDVSGALTQAGIKVTLISAGEGKTDGNAYEPLSDSARSDIQADVDRLYGEFVAAVSRGRGISESAVVRLGARLYQGGKAALGSGLANRTGSLGDGLRAANRGQLEIGDAIQQPLATAAGGQARPEDSHVKLAGLAEELGLVKHSDRAPAGTATLSGLAEELGLVKHSGRAGTGQSRSEDSPEVILSALAKELYKDSGRAAQ